MLYLFAPPLPEGGGQKYELLRGWGKNDYKPKQKKEKGRKKGKEKKVVNFIKRVTELLKNRSKNFK